MFFKIGLVGHPHPSFSAIFNWQEDKLFPYRASDSTSDVSPRI